MDDFEHFTSIQVVFVRERKCFQLQKVRTTLCPTGFIGRTKMTENVFISDIQKIEKNSKNQKYKIVPKVTFGISSRNRKYYG